jgi:hypothetical protein
VLQRGCANLDTTPRLTFRNEVGAHRSAPGLVRVATRFVPVDSVRAATGPGGAPGWSESRPLAAAANQVR